MIYRGGWVMVGFLLGMGLTCIVLGTFLLPGRCF